MVIRGSLLVFFEDPFWVGVVAREVDGAREMGRVVFGAEPTTPQIVEWVRDSYRRLVTIPVPESAEGESSAFGLGSTRPRNPKRAQRDAALARASRTATRAQQAVKHAYAAQPARSARSRQERDLEAERRRELKVQKRKQKHRGH